MKRILVVYYSQSGDVAQAAESFVEPLRQADVQVVMEHVRPVVEYPYPWKTPFRLFNVFPECLAELPPEIEPVSFDPNERFDLVILVYQVWFLAPSLPIQGFLQSEYANVLKDTKVITVSVSRNLWQSASETMKRRLGELGAIHLDNVVVTHQGPPWTTFISVLRGILFGKRNRLLGLFPPAGMSDEDQARLKRLGTSVAEQLETLDGVETGPLLAGQGAVKVVPRYVVPELMGWRSYRVWARIVLAAEKRARPLRLVAMGAFMIYVLMAVLIGIPVGILLGLITYPLPKPKLDQYLVQLAEPSGE